MPELYGNGLTDRAHFGKEASIGLSYTVLEGNSGIQTVNLENIVTVRRSSQVLSTYVDGRCNELVAVVGHKFITLTVHIYVQHGGRKAPLRAGLSVTAETCTVVLFTGGAMTQQVGIRLKV